MSQDAAGRARKLLDAVRNGLTIFFKAGDGWDIIGPADLITPGATVTVTKADKTTVQVIVRKVMAERTVDGVATKTATFDYIRTSAPIQQERPWYPVADRQAAAVGGMLGRTSSTKLGYCHYCGLELDRNGNCDECV